MPPQLRTERADAPGETYARTGPASTRPQASVHREDAGGAANNVSGRRTRAPQSRVAPGPLPGAGEGVSSRRGGPYEHAHRTCARKMRSGAASISDRWPLASDLTRQERVAAMRAGRLSRDELFAWVARHTRRSAPWSTASGSSSPRRWPSLIRIERARGCAELGGSVAWARARRCRSPDPADDSRVVMRRRSRRRELRRCWTSLPLSQRMA